MPHLAKSLVVQEDEQRRANRAVSLELWAIALFLPGLVLVIIAVILPTGFFVSQIAPEQVISSPEQMVFPQTLFGPWATFLGVLPFLLLAAFLMSAGVVVRHFMEKT
jgi:hypothetical protein